MYLIGDSILETLLLFLKSASLIRFSIFGEEDKGLWKWCRDGQGDKGEK